MIRKYYIALIMLLAGFGVISCDDVETDEKPGGTAVEEMAGTWTVTFEQSVDEYNYLFEGGVDPKLSSLSADDLAKQTWEDVDGKGKVSIMTSNTAANVPTEMWFIDKNFGGSSAAPYLAKCTIDYKARTFEVKDAKQSDGSTIDIIGGKILPGAATTPRGVKADSIVAYVKYSGNQDGFTYMKMSGYRYTGYAEDR